ncbi:MAG: efflux RND transporter periplasmic adaptor subunit [Pseudomonadota bacterium]|nr:efflux RND transporter periplasmic adaptor subunit [Pseudomonadota bacterium]
MMLFKTLFDMKSLIAIALLLFLTACGQETDNSSGNKHESKPHLVAITRVQQSHLSRTYERRGILKARRSVKIHALEEGMVISLPWYAGDAVKQGDELVHLDDELLQAELAKESARLDKEQKNLKRLQRLIKSKAASIDELVAAQTEVAVQQAEVTRLQTHIRRTSIRAPFDGIITERLVEAGDLATENSHLLTVVDPQSLVIDLSLPEFLLLQFKPQMQAMIRFGEQSQSDDKWFPATISRIYPTIDETTSMGLMELKPLTLPQDVLIGQRVNVRLETAVQNQISIPYQALQQSRDGHYVFVVEEGKVHKRPVEAAFLGSRIIVISSGLSDGETIVTRGFLGLEDDDMVKITE